MSSMDAEKDKLGKPNPPILQLLVLSLSDSWLKSGRTSRGVESLRSTIPEIGEEWGKALAIALSPSIEPV